ncbi:MAG TPA: polysaccharide deacetylase family protein [Verrucomicrobiae bacterium]|jgi:peptidoglycan/xylan/chitin deacetylase (PgdA/CDA1 family)
MLPPAMSRFHITLIVALLSGAVALTLGKMALLMAVIGAFTVVTGLGVAFPQMSFFGPFICRGDGSRRCVALTFDDGPDARSTPALLDLLREANVAATFFCIGKKVAAEGELAARILREGHWLGNHTFNHSHATNFFTAAKLRDELKKTQNAIQAATGGAPIYFRPPMGLSNPRIFRAARELKLSVIGWSARGLDTQCASPEKIVARIVRRLQPGGIILLHDGNIPAGRLVLTVRLLLANLRVRGYEVVRLDKILK